MGVTGPTRRSRRCAAPSERLAPAAADFTWRTLGEGLPMALGRSSERWMRPRRG